MKKDFGRSELILNSKQRIYHLDLAPGELAEKIILVGDPGRVELVAEFFEEIEVKRQNREFYTITGLFANTRVSVVSTGIGIDNIDIVLNELDALKNIDFENREEKSAFTPLDIVRIGTAGTLQDIPVDTPIATKYALGLDGLIYFYNNYSGIIAKEITDAFNNTVKLNPLNATPYIVEASEYLLRKIAGNMQTGITVTAPGFYGPQCRSLRMPLQQEYDNETLAGFSYNGYTITNYEMESSGVYALSKLLGHNALTVCQIIANRKQKSFSQSYNTRMKRLINYILKLYCD